MLSLQKTLPTMGEFHLLARKRLSDYFQIKFEKVQKENLDKNKYFILGAVKTTRKNGKTKIRVILKTYDQQPQIQKESYLYEIDNVENTQTLLWVMHTNNSLSLPTIGKKISVGTTSVS